MNTLEDTVWDILSRTDDSDGLDSGERFRVAGFVHRTTTRGEQTLCSRQVLPFLDLDRGRVVDSNIFYMRHKIRMEDGSIATSGSVGHTVYADGRTQSMFVRPDSAGFTGFWSQEMNGPEVGRLRPWIDRADTAANIEEILPEFYVRLSDANIRQFGKRWEDLCRDNDLWEMVDLSKAKFGWRSLVGMEKRSPTGWFVRLGSIRPLVAAGKKLFSSRNNFGEYLDQLTLALQRWLGPKMIYIGSSSVRSQDPFSRHDRRLTQSAYRRMIERPVYSDRVLRQDPGEIFEVTCLDSSADERLLTKHLNRQAMEAVRLLSQQTDTEYVKHQPKQQESGDSGKPE